MGNAVQTSESRVLQFTQSGELLRNVMDHAAVGMAILGAGERLLYANKSLCNILGYSVEELADLHLADLAPADRNSSAFVQFERLRAGKIADFKAECQFTTKDGSLTWVLLAASAMMTSAGRPWQIILQLSDIHKQKEAETALAYSESRWNFALEGARQGVWDHDIRKDRMFYSRMWRRIRGYADDENVNDSQEAWIARIHPDDRERILSVVAKQDSGEDGFDTLEYRERHRDGHYVWILSRGKPVEWDENGSPVRTVGTDTDITPLKQAEARLGEEKERLRVTLQSIGDGVISTDAEGRIRFINNVAAEITQWPAAEAAGKRITEVLRTISEDEPDRLLNPVAECLDTGKVWRPNADYLLTDRHGNTSHVRESAAPVISESGKTVGAVIVFRDTTESRKMERELAYSAAHDSLTDLPNRATFEKKLDAAIESARDEQRVHSLCLIDLDRFKPVNDQLGHAAGDALLKEVASAIRNCCRRDDFGARIGGDEFALILPDCSAENATRVAQKAVNTIAGLKFEWRGHQVSVGASVGVAEIAGSADADTLYHQADTACYVAKNSGRSCVKVYDGQTPVSPSTNGNSR